MWDIYTPQLIRNVEAEFSHSMRPRMVRLMFLVSASYSVQGQALQTAVPA